MANSIKKIGVLTSGGDAPGMNAAAKCGAWFCGMGQEPEGQVPRGNVILPSIG